MLWSDESIPSISRPGRYSLGLQFGARHESNGRSGDESRSLNTVYIRPIVTLGDPKAFHVDARPARTSPTSAARAGTRTSRTTAATATSAPPLAGATGSKRVLARLGDDWDKGSVQLDLTYP